MLGDCPIIHVGGAHELFRRFIQHIRLGGLSNRFYQNSVVCFREQKSFVLKTVFFFSRHGIEHVDIQVGSCM